jgi:hypothetical protein
VRYRVQITTGGEPPQEAWFEVVDPVGVKTIRRDLAELAAAAGPMLSANTLVAVQAAYLANRGLLVDSRRALMLALENQPDEMTFHVLLGDIYERLGLPEQAAGSFAKARLLLQGHTNR